MKSNLFDHGWRFAFALLIGSGSCAAALTQELPTARPAGSDLLLPRNLEMLAAPGIGAVPPPSRVAHFRLFGMPPGFLSSPVGLDQDDRSEERRVGKEGTV